MRVCVVLMATAVVLAGCGSSPSVGTVSVDDTVAPPATSPAPMTDVTATTIEPGTDPAKQPGADEQQIAPPDEPRHEADAVDRRSIADALLPDDAFGPPWEPQSRVFDRPATPSGPDQTTCPAYWAFETLLGRGGGHALWWRDGGNANHHVVRVVSGDVELVQTMLAALRIAEECPVVKWLEGGSFTVEQLEFDDAVGMRFDDRESGESTWVLLTAHADLVSILSMPIWPAADGTPPAPTDDELEALASQMYERLLAAGPADDADAPVIVPATTLPRSTVTTTTVTAGTVPPVVDGLGELLLTADELPDGWRLDGSSSYTAPGGDDDLVDTCPPAASMERIDAALAWEADFTAATGGDAFELIGDLGSAEAAAAAVEEFASVAECDFGDVMPGAAWSGGFEDVPGADVAARLTAELDDEDTGARFDLIIVAIDSIVIVVSHEGPLGTSGEPIADLAARATAKAVAG